MLTFLEAWERLFSSGNILRNVASSSHYSIFQNNPLISVWISTKHPFIFVFNYYHSNNLQCILYFPNISSPIWSNIVQIWSSRLLSQRHSAGVGALIIYFHNLNENKLQVYGLQMHLRTKSIYCKFKKLNINVTQTFRVTVCKYYLSPK